MPAFAEVFAAWMADAAELTDGAVVAIDGKTLRRSLSKASNKAAIHIVSAFAAENSVVLGQVKTADKSNEITAIPELLKLLRLKGCLVTIDAMGCQRDIAEQIIDHGSDYLLAVKGNQPTLERRPWSGESQKTSRPWAAATPAMKNGALVARSCTRCG